MIRLINKNKIQYWMNKINNLWLLIKIYHTIYKIKQTLNKIISIIKQTLKMIISKIK